MSYQDTTYIIFDGDKDRWAYSYMKGCKSHDHVDFDFRDAHELKEIRDWSQPDTVKRTLRQRFSTTGQVIVLIGDETKHHHRFVRWEMDVALSLDSPIIAINLNGLRQMDPELCPPIIRGEYVVHVSFKMRIIKYALDNFPAEYHRRQPSLKGARYYKDDVYVAGDSSLTFEEGMKLWKETPNDDSQYRYFKYHLMVKYLLETERLTVDEVFQRAFDEKELAARVFKSL